MLEALASLTMFFYDKAREASHKLDKKLKLHWLIEQIAKTSHGHYVIPKSIVDLHELAHNIIQSGGELITEFTYTFRRSCSLQHLKVAVYKFRGKIVELGLRNNDKLNVVWYSDEEPMRSQFTAIKAMV